MTHIKRMKLNKPTIQSADRFANFRKTVNTQDKKLETIIASENSSLDLREMNETAKIAMGRKNPNIPPVEEFAYWNTDTMLVAFGWG